MPKNQITDFALLCDVLKLQQDGFNSNDPFWKRIVFGGTILKSQFYQSYSNEEIIGLGDAINDKVADQMWDDFYTFCKSNGFSI